VTSKIGLLNALALLCAFTLSVTAFLRLVPRTNSTDSAAAAASNALADAASHAIKPGPDGTPSLLDRSGNLVPLRDYQRIASASTVADALLLEFTSPNRIAAFTHYHKSAELTGHRYQGRPQLDAVHDFETLLSLRPDLLIVSTLSSGVRIERLREAGLAVFVLGEMRGMDSYLDSALDVATLVGKRELGQSYVKGFRQRMASIAATLPEERRKTALQLVYYGRQLYGSGTQTSYFDVLNAAGLVDLGAVHFTGWPALTADQVLVINPEVIVTRTGMGTQLCTQENLSMLKACAAGSAGIVELPDELLNDPGALMLPSAEQIYAAVYGG
jgi:iron complex transport system substrate-binding protein